MLSLYVMLLDSYAGRLVTRRDVAVDPVLLCLLKHPSVLHLKVSDVVQLSSQGSAVNNVVCQGRRGAALYKQ